MRKPVLFVLVAGAITILGTSDSQSRSALADSTDLKVRNSSGVDALGSENSVFIHPTDSKIVLISQNNHGGGLISGVDGWVSQDGGKTWSGDNSSIGGAGRGDPAAVIRRGLGASPVRYLVGQLGHQDGHEADLEVGQVVMYKESATSLTWTPRTVVNNALGSTDKNHLWVDNHPSSGRLHAAWTNVGDRKVEAMYSPNGGDTWLSRQPVSAGGLVSEWGVNLVVGTASSNLGHVYAAWGQTEARGDLSAPGFKVTGLFFNKSEDGGDNWSIPTLITSLFGRGYAKIDPELTGGKDMGTTSAPNLATDNAGNLYVVWTQKRTGESDADAEVYIMKSVNQGSPWTALGSDPKRVSSTSTGDQWHSWVTYDDCTDAIVVVYFDSRNDNSKAEAYLSVSYDGGANFLAQNEVKVSDVSWSGDDGARDAGEYIGIAARDGIAYPGWSDDRETVGTFKVYTSPIYLWGVTQSSVTHTIANGPELELGVTGYWNSSMAALGTDAIVATSPTNVVYTATGAAASPYLTHAVKVVCQCEVGTWKYIVKSTRPGFTPRGSDQKTFVVHICVD